MMSHVLDEAGFAAAGGPLEQHRQAGLVSGFEDLDFVADRQVVGRAMGVEVAHFGAFATALDTSVKSFQFNSHVMSIWRLRMTGRDALSHWMDCRRGDARPSRHHRLWY